MGTLDKNHEEGHSGGTRKNITGKSGGFPKFLSTVIFVRTVHRKRDHRETGRKQCNYQAYALLPSSSGFIIRVRRAKVETP